jgi:hypothetical protein
MNATGAQVVRILSDTNVACVNDKAIKKKNKELL